MSTTKESTWWTAYWFQLLVVMFGLTIFYIFLFLFFMHAAWDWWRSPANGLTLIPQRCRGYRRGVLVQSMLRERDKSSDGGWGGVILNSHRDEMNGTFAVCLITKNIFLRKLSFKKNHFRTVWHVGNIWTSVSLLCVELWVWFEGVGGELKSLVFPDSLPARGSLFGKETRLYRQCFIFCFSTLIMVACGFWSIYSASRVFNTWVFSRLFILFSLVHSKLYMLVF